MKPFDQPSAIRKGEALDVEKLTAYLKENLSGLKGPASVKQFHSGYSNLTYLVSIGDTELVLRRPPFGKKAKTAHDMNREYRILSAIKPCFPHVPAPLLYCDDPAVMDCPFYVMERLRGVILRRDLPEGVILDAETARKLCQRWVDVFVELHHIDCIQCGIEGLGTSEGYVARQVHGWSKRYRAARTDDVTDFETVQDWLKDNMPQDYDREPLIHNDFKFDNVILDPEDLTRIIGVLDWEMATIGNPLMDLGASLGYWVQHGDPDEMDGMRTLPSLLPGMATRKELVEMYAESAEITIDNFAWYYCFGLFRLAAIMQQIYYRFYHGQTKDKRFAILGPAVHILERAALRVMETGNY